MRIKYAFIFLVSFNLFATQQQNDVIEYKGQQSELEINLGSSSPLVAYFADDKQDDYPFQELSTGNYRGHIATWEVLNDKLYLTQIIVPKTIFNESTKTIAETENRVELSDVLPKTLIKNKKAIATWFTGHLLVKSSPFKEWYKPEYSDDEYYTMEFKEYTVIQIKNGAVINEKTFESKDFWNLTNRYLGYKSIGKDDLDVISGFYNNGSRFVRSERTEEPKQTVYSEDDFDVFLEREFINKVNVPLSEYCVITDVSINTKGNGWFSEDNFKIKKGSNVLYIEMGTTNIPNGPWDDFTGGSVQILVPLENINKGKIINRENVRYINNFAKHRSPNSIDIDLNIINIKNDSLQLEGVIKLQSEEPKTFQKIDFGGKEVPIYSLLEYLKKHQNDSEYFKYDADEVYEEIKEKSNR